jgi:hypothetical protein
MILLTACASSDSGGDERRSGADELILRVETSGGFVPVGISLTELPHFSLYGDGRVITQGPQILIYPGPALPNLIERKVSAEGVDAIVDAARRAGLAGPDRNLPLDRVADAPTTTFTLVIAGRRHAVSAYALGLEAELEAGLPPEQREARQALIAFQERLNGLEAWLPDGSVGKEHPFQIEHLRVFVLPGRIAPDDEAPPQPPTEWPLAEPLSEFGNPATQPEMRCGTLEGEDLRVVLERATRANQLTPWTSRSGTYSLYFRPLLPDESGCPGLA